MHIGDQAAVKTILSFPITWKVLSYTKLKPLQSDIKRNDHRLTIDNLLNHEHFNEAN